MSQAGVAGQRLLENLDSALSQSLKGLDAGDEYPARQVMFGMYWLEKEDEHGDTESSSGENS